jgi:hypothetical protein
MAWKNNATRFLQVAVYFGGAQLGRYERPLTSCRGVTVGKSFTCNIRSVIWPRWDDLDLILKTKTGLVLNPNLPWNGVFSDGRQTHVLNTKKPVRRFLEITSGATASLKLDDLSIAIRVAPLKRADAKRVLRVPGYGASFFSLIADRSSEWAAIAVSGCAAAAISISAYITMQQRDNDTYVTLAELPGERLLPFIAHKYLAEAPHVLQSTLDRFSYIHSIWDYYDDLTHVVAFGEKPESSTKIFPSTVKSYLSMEQTQAHMIKESESRQRSQQNDPRGLASVSMPMVLGESLDGRAQRTLDKIFVISSSAKPLATRRNSVADEFEKDMGYKYKPAAASDETAKTFGAISAGFLGIEDDEKSQFTQARTHATNASILQMKLYGDERLVFGPIRCCNAPLGAPLTHDNLSWLPPSFGTRNSNELAALKASIWGAPINDKPRLREPISGKISPNLVERTVSSGRYQIRLCYELALRRNQTAKGSMEWKWKIDTQGKISGLDLLHSSIKDEELVRCVRDKIAAWKFPKPTGGSVEVRYPFEFSRDKG